jgi:hypothetical protein
MTAGSVATGSASGERATDRAGTVPQGTVAAGSGEHLVPLGATGWSVWRDVLLRSTGFPADGLDRFAAPGCAKAADALLAAESGAGGAFGEAFDQAFNQAVAVSAAEVTRLAGDPLFREAVAWQNPGAVVALDGLVRGGPGQARTAKRRHREEVIARYWQRYCAKNETVGFFGPVAWATLDPGERAVAVRPGAGLVRDRRVFLEHWALAAYADRVAEDPDVRRWLPPMVLPQLSLRDAGRLVLRPAQPPLAVSAVEAAALTRCDDGRRPALAVVADLLADPALGVRQEADGYLLLERLVARALLSWGANLPMGPDAEAVLRRRLGAIGDERVRARALGGLDRLGAARDRVAAAAGDPDALRAALAALDAEFTALTGQPARRRAGQTYAGRALCYEEAVRDVDLTVGGPVLDALAAPLAILLRAARWLTDALARRYGDALRELYAELRADGEVGLGELWYLAQGPLFGSGGRPVDAVAGEFARRWAGLFGLDTVPAGTRALAFTAKELAGPAAAAFPADRPGWATGRLHSPDLHVCARGVEELGRGEFVVVLGELHAAWPTFDCAVFTWAHPELAWLRRALAEDTGPRRVRPLYPADWPRYTGRLAHTLDAPTDPQLGFAAAPGADPDRLLPVTSVTVSEDGGELVARAPDGRSWPLLEMFSALVSMHAVEGFKLVGAAPHTPRITLDRLVVARETWRATVGATGLADVTGERPRYLAARRWRRDLGLPERVFVKAGTETKPFYVDFTSPLYVSSLCTMLRSARAAGGDGVPVTVTEMLPTPDQAWLPDAAGRRYLSELRLHARDPRPARTLRASPGTSPAPAPGPLARDGGDGGGGRP